MASFTPGGPEIPPPQFEIPVPEIPRANFSDIGRELEHGRQQARAADKSEPGWFSWVGGLVGLIISTTLQFVGEIIGTAIRWWFKLFHEAEEGTDEISRQAIAGMLGVEIPANLFSNVTGAEGRRSVHESISQIVLQGLFPGATTGSAGAIQPGHAGADNFINLSSRMAIEGWLQGWVFEAASLGQVETFAELKDIMERTLGIGRLMRRVLAPPMKILLADPFTWELNSKYHPTLLQPGELVREYLRGRLDRTELQARMDYHGYSSDNVSALINTGKLHLSAAELLTLELHSSRTQADTLTALQAQGYDADTAAQKRFVELQGKLDSWNLAIVNELSAAVVDRKIEIARLDEFMDEAGLPALEKALIHLLTENKLAFNRKRFSIAEGEQLVKKGLWTLDQFRDLARFYGYSDGDELTLELLVLGEVKDKSDADAKRAELAKQKKAAADAKAAAAAAKAAEVKSAAESKGLSLSKYETLVNDGLRTLAQYRAFALGKGIAADNADALVQALQGTQAKAADAAATKAAAANKAKLKHLDISQLDAAVKDGAISIDEYKARLVAADIDPADVEILAQVLGDQLDQAKAKAAATADAKAAASAKKLNIADEQRAVRLGLATIDDYAAFLVKNGFTDEDSTILVGELDAQLASDKAAKAAKAKVAADLANKGLSLPQLEKAVRAGVSTITAYRQALAQAGYDQAAQDSLVNLLQLQLDQDKQTLAVKGTASALLGVRGVSLTDLERAVKLGVVPISVYTDALARSGVSASDAQLLTLSLAAAAKQSKAAASSAASASKVLAAKGLDLAQLEKDVLAGRLTLAQLRATLVGAGLAAASVTDITTLLQDELDNAKAAAALLQDAAQKAAVKHLDLSQAIAAVRADVTTIDDFRAFVGELGYDAADVATIVATLAAQLASKATKASQPKASTTPA